METCPAEIWQEIFTLACTDAGYTGRSLSLVSKYIHDISAPFKYQSLAITQWRQIITFSQTFSQLPDSQKKIKYLFVYCQYPFVDADGNERLGDRTVLDSEGNRIDNNTGKSYDISEWESVYSKIERSLNSEDERELLEDARDPQAVRNGSEGNTRRLLNGEIQSFLNNILEAFRAILHETSSTLTVLGVYWTSLEAPQIHRLLPPLPRLQELHLHRNPSTHLTFTAEHKEPLTTSPFPLLRFLYMSGEHPSDIPLKDELAILAPDLTHLRFRNHHLLAGGFGNQCSTHSFNLHVGGIIIEIRDSWSPRKLKQLVEHMFGTSIQVIPHGLQRERDIDEARCLQRWWADRVAGESGPWGALSITNHH